MKKYCLALNLKDNPVLIKEYEEYHREVWPEVTDAIRLSGILSMEIYRLDTRMVMIIETKDDFSFERKKIIDETNAKVREWEELMWKFQEPMPGRPNNEKWALMNKIYDLNE